MGTLQQLVEQHCPNGVEYVRLGDVMEMKRGTSITKKQVTPGLIPVIAGGRSAAYFHGVSNRSGETIVVAGSGAYAGHVSWWDTEIFVSDAFSIKSVNSATCLRYIYHYMSSMQQTLYDLKSSGGVPHVYIKDVAPLEIPLPPRVVQEKIVDYLDALSAVYENLDTEIAQREQQFEVYRGILMASATGDEVNLGNVAEYSTRRVSADGLTRENYVGVDNLLKDLGGKISSEYGPNTKNVTAYATGDVLIGNIRPYLKKIWRANNDGGCSGDVLAIHPTKISSRYLYLVLSAPDFWRFNDQHSRGGKMPRGDKKAILAYNFVLPPLSVQEYIADKLDAIQALIDNLKHERELRGQQFEFYRTQLLAFVAKDSTTND